MNSFIKYLMDEKKLKQKELAQILGISSAAVSQWNDDGTNIKANWLFTLSKLFHVTVDELLAGKRSGESLEDKWAREYNVNEEAARGALINGEKEKVLNYFNILSKVNARFFCLFRKMIEDNISDLELKEWKYFKQYYKIEVYKSQELKDFQFYRENGDIDYKIINIMKVKMGAENTDSIIWELQKIYNITHYGIKITSDKEIISTEDQSDDFWDTLLDLSGLKDDEDIFFAVYNSLSPIEKDMFLTSEFHKQKKAEYLFELIKRDGKILYLPSELNLVNYDFKDLDELEGEIKAVPELEAAQAVVREVYDQYSLVKFDQYQMLINHPRMEQIKMEAIYRDCEPIKYWEYIKGVDFLI